MAYCYIAGKIPIDFRHHPAKYPSMGRCVLQLVAENVVMNHLMYYGILQQTFIHIPVGTDNQLEITILPTSKEF
jgi:hypothetical protein